MVIAGVVGKVLGAFYRIPLSNILGPEGVGLYQMIFPVFSLALIICSGGVSATISHMIAKIRASGEGSIRQVFLKGFFYTLTTSLIFALLFVFFGEKIASFQGNSLASAGYKMCAIALVFSAILASFRGLFQGFQNMSPTATSQIIEQIFKVAFGLIFAFYFVGESTELGVVGAFFGITIAEIIAFFYLFFKAKNFEFQKPQKYAKIPFLKTNFLITLNYLIIPVLTAFDSFVVINLLSKNFSAGLSTSLYGLQSGMVNSLINFPVVISVAISLAILPELSFSMAQKDSQKAKETISKIFTFLLVILTPCILGFVFFAEDILGVLYASLSLDLLQTASLLLQISALQILFISILQASTTVFQSLDRPSVPIFVLLGCSVVKILLTVLLVASPEINIFGLSIANLIFYALSAVFCLYFVKKFVRFSLNLKVLIVTTGNLLILATSFWLIDVYIKIFWAKIALILASAMVYLALVFVFDILETNYVLKQKFLKWRIKNE